MQHSLRKRLGLINKIFHRATAKLCGPCMAGSVSIGRLSPSPTNLMLSQGSCEGSGRPLPGSHMWSPSSSKWFQRTILFIFYFSKSDGEIIMNVETLTYAENWMDCLHI